MKVYMLPTPSQAIRDTTNSINQIVLHLTTHLPAYGVEVVEDELSADLVAGHAGQTGGIRTVDVAHCHGLYPTAEFTEPKWFRAANEAVIANLRQAYAVTAPSEWVADILRRDMHLEPTVVGWAIQPDQWQVQEHQSYTLWNKTRTGGVCDPAPLNWLARQFPEHRFMTTFGDELPNMTVTGRVEFEKMRQMIHGAEVYLATTKETFGIGILEAMACGVPVLGYRWGALPDIIEHGVHGFLAAPGDLDGLARGLVYCQEHRAVLGANARKRALEYTWEQVAQQFAEVYQAVVWRKRPREIKVSVVIPCHNYGLYVGQAIDSVLNQEVTFPLECIVVNDGSTDNSADVIAGYTHDSRLRVITHPHGNGPAYARNVGIEKARGEYIMCLDADDYLGAPHVLQLLHDELNAERAFGMVYTGLQTIAPDGQLGHNWNGWPPAADYLEQCKGKNQIPTCNLFRKEAWIRAGGYRYMWEPAEDAEFWTRILSVGYGAKKVTEERLFHYRLHNESLSARVRGQREREPDWRRNLPHCRDGQHPFAAPAGNEHSWPVRNYDQPIVSVIIPVGPGHEAYVLDALDTVEGQTERMWECIVVNDTGHDLYLMGRPWAKVVNNTGELQGAGAARNCGAQHATAPLITFLDADDLWEPDYLATMLLAYRANTARYVYCDWYALNKEGIRETHDTPEYDFGLLFRKLSIHSINVIISKADFEIVGGFREDMPSWEDAEFFLRCAIQGMCGHRVAQHLITYRYQTGALREIGVNRKPELRQTIYELHKDYIEGRIMCACNDKPDQKAKPGTLLTVGANDKVNGDAQRVLYQGPIGAIMVIGPASKQRYGVRQRGDIFLAWASDIQADPVRFVPLTDIQPIEQKTVIPPEPELIA